MDHRVASRARRRWIGVVFALFITFFTLAPAARERERAPDSPPAAGTESPALQEAIDPQNLDTARLAAAIFHETNRERARLGLPRLGWLAKLDAAADLQANSSALSQTSGHVNFFPSLAQPQDRVRHVGLKARMVGENAALIPVLRFDPAHGYYERKKNGETVLLDATTDRAIQPHTYASFAKAVVEAWMNSPGHRANLANPDFQFLGCSGRLSRSLSRLDMIACVQVFFTPTR